MESKGLQGQVIAGLISQFPRRMDRDRLRFDVRRHVLYPTFSDAFKKEKEKTESGDTVSGAWGFYRVILDWSIARRL